ncbi:alkaline-phosphatase-like protein [Halteromyces radiatus]|uniref:alkaline-phosphatase-like protein n=1 Tax=Halteromyces radiatus TaxID=101107 RepID=UPI0022209847|nr:alkaline-phosphatase-like protein [Halteromyces radiatus]KAI8086295.1 alkaline-phosphatase-like protein [Halteromyces radiatus]
MKLSLLGSAALFLLHTLSLVHESAAANDGKPNILFIFTDDQDARLNSIDYMPNLQKHLVKQGTLHRNHYATIAICCPSRVSLLRGQYAHNTNITDVSPPYGGYSRFNKLGLGESTLPIWLQEAGYHTNYIGKLMNEYSVNNYNNPTPKGFDYQDQLVDPYTYVYNKPVFSKDGESPVFYKNAYQTDVIHAKALQALKNQRNSDKPFFLWVAPMAPHGQFSFQNGVMKTEPPVPAARHAHLFKDVKIARTPNFNPKKQTKTASFWKGLSHLNNTLVDQFDEIHRNRLRALQAVDEMIGTLFDELQHQGKLDNTYVIYSADNGYHLGQHRAYPGKCGNIEEDINVPFIVRGPGIPKGKVSDIVSAHHDLAPTFLALAKGSQHVPDWVDGGVIPLTHDLQKHPKTVAKESFAVEFWMQDAMPEFYPEVKAEGPNTYKTLRVISKDYNYMYSVWCTGEHEFYDLKNDPYETINKYHHIDEQLLNRLDALLLVLKSCRAENCRDPWRILHPHDPSVKTLADALHHKFDQHYSQYKHVSFSECLPYISVFNEQPVIGHHFKANSTTLATTNLTTDINKSEKVLQKLLRSSITIPSTSYQEDDDEYIKNVIRLHQMIPDPDDEDSVGLERLSEDFEKDAIPVPEELVTSQIDWVKHGFYNAFGN